MAIARRRRLLPASEDRERSRIIKEVSFIVVGATEPSLIDGRALGSPGAVLARFGPGARWTGGNGHEITSIAHPRREAVAEGRRSGFAWTPLGQILWRHKLFLCCVAVCAVALTSAYVSHVPAVFEAETLVLIGEGDGRSDLPENLAVPTAQGGRTGAVTAIGSPAMALRLVDALSLHLLPEFNPTLRPDTAGRSDWFDPIRLVPNSLFNRLPVIAAACPPRQSGGDGPAARRVASRRGCCPGPGPHRGGTGRPTRRHPGEVRLVRSPLGRVGCQHPGGALSGRPACRRPGRIEQGAGVSLRRDRQASCHDRGRRAPEPGGSGGAVGCRRWGGPGAGAAGGSRPARNLQHAARGDRSTGVCAGARRAGHLGRDHAEPPGQSPREADSRRRPARCAAARCAGHLGARAARRHHQQCGAAAAAQPRAAGDAAHDPARAGPAPGARPTHSRLPRCPVRPGGGCVARWPGAGQCAGAPGHGPAGLGACGRGHDDDRALAGALPRARRRTPAADRLRPCQASPAYAHRRHRRGGACRGVARGADPR